MAAALSTISLRFSDTAGSKNGPVPSVRRERERKKTVIKLLEAEVCICEGLGFVFIC